MTRWEEVEDRLHVLTDILSYLPVTNIRIHFLNRSTDLRLTHAGKTPDQFAKEVHDQIYLAFASPPSGGTPLFAKMQNAFNQQTVKGIMHYVFTDGVPSDASIHALGDLVQYRANPKMHPLTFMSCTDNDQEAEWMKTIEESGPYVSELDDFNSEQKEVLHDQGPSFPFSRGFWLLCQLVAAINPDDLDALDENTPFSRYTLSSLLGREMSPQEYNHYFGNHPQSQHFKNLYQRLMNENTSAKQIMNAPAPSNYAPASQPPYSGAVQQMMFTPPPPPFPGPAPELPKAEYSGYQRR